VVLEPALLSNQLEISVEKVISLSFCIESDGAPSSVIKSIEHGYPSLSYYQGSIWVELARVFELGPLGRKREREKVELAFRNS
jgi:hypothetical protein